MTLFVEKRIWRITSSRKTRSKARGFVEFKNLKVLLIRKGTRIVRVKFYQVYFNARARCVNTLGLAYTFLAKPFRRKIFLNTEKTRTIQSTTYTFMHFTTNSRCVRATRNTLITGRTNVARFKLFTPYFDFCPFRHLPEIYSF